MATQLMMAPYLNKMLSFSTSRERIFSNFSIKFCNLGKAFYLRAQKARGTWERKEKFKSALNGTGE